MTATAAFAPDDRVSVRALRPRLRPSTAVLIVNYKAYVELRACLTSLMPQLGMDDEVVVVDNESDAQALRAAVGGYPFVSAIRCVDNLGFAAGANLAATRARATFLLLLNPDTLIEGPVVRVLSDRLMTDPDVGVVAPRVLNFDGSVQATARRFPNATTAIGGRSTWMTRRFPNNWLSRRNLVARSASQPVDVDWLSGACFMTRRDLFERLGGFDERFFLYWEDADYCLRAAAAGARRVYVPTVDVRHLAGRSSDRNPVEAIRAFHRSAYLMFREQASWPARVIAPLVRFGLWARAEWRIRRHARRPDLISRSSVTEMRSIDPARVPLTCPKGP